MKHTFQPDSKEKAELVHDLEVATAMTTRAETSLEATRATLATVKGELNKVHPDKAASDAESKEQAKRIESLKSQLKDVKRREKYYLLVFFLMHQALN